MKVVYQGRPYYIQFSYGTVNKRRFTCCEILRGILRAGDPPTATEHESLTMGIAICHRQDHFMKTTGRDLAFRRAMDIAQTKNLIERPLRALLWQAYRERGIHPAT